MSRARIEIEPLTAGRWDDVVRLFGSRGACGGCWCMTPRLTRTEFERRKGASNRAAFRRIVKSGREPGVLAYRGGEPIGWCAVEPREHYSSLARSRILKPVDDQPVWSIVCLFVAGEHRRTGVSVALIRGAVEHARSRGGTIVEAYPVEPATGSMPDVFAWTGIDSAYRKAGFQEVARRSARRPVMRYNLS